MITKTNSKNSLLKQNVTKAAFIQYQLKKRGLSQKQKASELNITPVAVSRSINGLSKITRVDEWLQNNLGMEVING